MTIKLKYISKKWRTPYKLLKRIRNRSRKFKALIEAVWFRLLKKCRKQNNLLLNLKSVSSEKILQSTDGRKIPKFFISSEQREDFLELLSEQHKNDILSEANEITRHRFRILGEIIHFEDEIDWHLDPKSGHRWPLRYYKRLLPVFNTTDNTDGKMPYELSRFNKLTILGMAYWITEDEKYFPEFINEIESWISKNPYPYGVNWTCAMDVAIRACNLIAGFYFFKDSQRISDEFFKRLFESLYKHGRYIMANLEYSESLTSNHYLSDIVGLVYLGTMFPEFKEAKKWKEFGIKELTKGMETQVYPDGCDFEASTCYHRLVLELFFFGTLLVVINDSESNGENYKKVCQKIFGQEYTEKLLKMFEVVLYLLKPNGHMPQIGDNDSGRLHVFANREMLDMRYLLTLGAIFFGEPKLKVREFGFCEEALWVFGEKGYRIWKDLEENSYKNINSRSFPDAGWYILRHNNDYCFISCGPNGQGGNGGHAHNDKLSFELILDGQDVIVDPGTYTYTAYPKERNKFRSTEYHNTVKFNDYEQNEIPEKNMFSLADTVLIKEAKLTETDNNITFQGEIRYLDFTHKRTIILDKKSCNWQIIDRISCGKAVDAKLTFHLSPDVFFDDGFILSKKTKKRIVSIEIPGHSIEKAEYDYSPEYGVKLRAECLVANISSTKDVKTIKTYIYKI